MTPNIAQDFYLDLFTHFVEFRHYKAPHAMLPTPPRPKHSRATRAKRLFKGWRP